MLLHDSEVVVTVELYIWGRFDTFLLSAQNKRFEVFEMQGQACKIVDTTDRLSPGSLAFLCSWETWLE